MTMGTLASGISPRVKFVQVGLALEQIRLRFRGLLPCHGVCDREEDNDGRRGDKGRSSADGKARPEASRSLTVEVPHDVVIWTGNGPRVDEGTHPGDERESRHE